MLALYVNRFLTRLLLLFPLFVLPLLLLPPGSGATSTASAMELDPHGQLRLIDHWSSAPPTALAARGKLAYVGFGSDLVVMDFTEPQRPQRIGFHRFSSNIEALTLAGHYLYVIVQPAMHILNVATPSMPVHQGTYHAGSPVDSVAVIDRHAYLRMRFSGLRVVDTSDPTHPQEVGSDHRSYTGPIAASGNILFISTSPVIMQYHLLRALDFSDPANPVEVASISLPGYVSTMRTSGDHLYIGGYGYRAFVGTENDPYMQVVDISNPARPVARGIYHTRPTSVTEVLLAVEGQHAYLAWGAVNRAGGFWGTMVSIDVSDPGNPIQASEFYSLSGPPRAFAQGDDFAFSANGRRWSAVPPPDTIDFGGLEVIDVSAPALPAQAHLYKPLPPFSDIVEVGQYLYLGGHHLLVTETGDGWPVVVDSLLGASLKKLVATQSYIYGLAEPDMIEIWDISSSGQPTHAGQLNLNAGRPYDIALEHSYMYVAGGAGGLRILDITSPRAPAEVGVYEAPAEITSVAVAGNYGYVGQVDKTFSAHLHILDVSNPADPAPASVYEMPAITDIALSGDYAYVAAGFWGFYILDISSPSQPVEMGRYEPPGAVQGVAIRGNYAYLAVNGTGLHVMDISDPSNPQRQFLDPTPADAQNVRLAGETIYVMTEAGGVFMFKHVWLTQHLYLPLVPQQVKS
jgi:hypothetical protein